METKSQRSRPAPASRERRNAVHAPRAGSTHADAPHVDAARGATAQGDTAQVDTAQGDTARVDPAAPDARARDRVPNGSERAERSSPPRAAGIDANTAGAPAVHATSTRAARRPRLFAELDAPPPAEPSEPAARVPRWRTLFAAASAREILARIVPDDPLGVRAVVARRLHDQALLADADRVHLRSLALVARWAPRYQGEPDFAVWLERIVDRALVEIVGDDLDEAPVPAVVNTPGATAPSSEPESCIVASARALGLSAERLRSACRAFNRAPTDERRAFFELVLRARPLQDVARESGRSAVELARLARRALDTLLAPVPAPAPNATHATPLSSATAPAEALEP